VFGGVLADLAFRASNDARLFALVIGATALLTAGLEWMVRFRGNRWRMDLADAAGGDGIEVTVLDLSQPLHVQNRLAS
jgi:hypothetical protein